jgi:class 3 adenylate cyclase
MLAAIGKLAGATSAIPEPAAETDPKAQESPERRQVTVMFCDLVGSTALASRFDPEDLRGIIGGYHRCVAGTVARFDGFVAKYMGDGVLVYFGYPQAHEDDADQHGTGLESAEPKPRHGPVAGGVGSRGAQAIRLSGKKRKREVDESEEAQITRPLTQKCSRDRRPICRLRAAAVSGVQRHGIRADFVQSCPLRVPTDLAPVLHQLSC